MRNSGWCFAVLFLTLAGCSQSPAAGAGKTDGLKVGDMISEYRAEAATLKLADGWGWPGDQSFLAKTEDGHNVVYQPGFGRQAADRRWYCSWVSKALAGGATSKDREGALAEALKVRQTYYYTTSLQAESRTFFEDVLRRASLGDLAPIAGDFQQNCTKESI
ncbi:hypothetical protein F1D05_05940 [Kribbella qitaiheensis]|uniref:Lipoprotein n=1 Tax=Kribbella qitaiheensis TaxID=1544730 RepID=A0A7G6WU69_9ACTN|nr:hypothetical protein [Kribbella qitaiheensis]QNE17534.1 hypothetical protein F1D05_05940 [Kribbella qitaiheensis]